MQVLPALVFFAAAALAPPQASAAAPGSGEILQQRTEDGRTLLTDRPVAGARTERRWSVEAEIGRTVLRPAVDAPLEATRLGHAVHRHIDAQWRPVPFDDPQRESVVRSTLERERMERLALAMTAWPREPAITGSGRRGNR